MNNNNHPELTPFFIIGAQRSGTTLLRLILNSHSMIAIPEEGTFWMPLIRTLKERYQQPIDQNTLKQYIKFIRKNDQFRAWRLNATAVFEKLLELDKVCLQDLMGALYSDYARTKNKTYWADKTPSFFRKVHELAEIFPGARFIHIIRDGRDAYLSQRHKDPTKSNVAVAALEWTYKIEHARKQLASLPADSSYELRFEDLLTKPEEKAREITSFLGIEYEDTMLNFHQSSHKYVGYHHSDLLFTPISTKAAYRWKKDMTSAENQVFEYIANRCLQDLNYNFVNEGPVPFTVKSRTILKLAFGLPYRAFQIFRTALILRLATVFGFRTTVSGGEAYKKEMILAMSPLSYTGLAFYDFSLNQALAEQGVDVELCVSDNWFLGQKKNNFQIHVAYRKCSGKRNKILKGLNYLLSTFRLFFHALKNGTKRIHFQILEVPVIDFLLLAALKLCGRSIVHTPHDITHNKDYPLNNWVVTKIYQISDRIIVHKEANKRTLQKLFDLDPEKIKIIPHGSYEYFVDNSITREESRRKLGFSPDLRIILFFGTIKPSKGLDLLLQSIKIVSKTHSNFLLLIAGKPTHGLTEELVLEQINNYDIADIALTRFGFIPDDEVIYYYKVADIIVLPYTEVSESGVLRYAQTCAQPVICSDLNEFKDTVIDGQTGYFFRTEDCTDLANKIAFSLDNPDALEQVGQNALKLMQDHYSWDKIAISTNNIYNKLV